MEKDINSQIKSVKDRVAELEKDLKRAKQMDQALKTLEENTYRDALNFSIRAIREEIIEYGSIEAEDSAISSCDVYTILDIYTSPISSNTYIIRTPEGLKSFEVNYIQNSLETLSLWCAGIKHTGLDFNFRNLQRLKEAEKIIDLHYAVSENYSDYEIANIRKEIKEAKEELSKLLVHKEAMLEAELKLK